MPEDEALRPRPGDIAEVEITYAAPHHLTADKGLLSLRRTRGGDAWQARRDGVDAPVVAGSVGLGIPDSAYRRRCRRPRPASSADPRDR